MVECRKYNLRTIILDIKFIAQLVQIFLVNSSLDKQTHRLLPLLKRASSSLHILQQMPKYTKSCLYICLTQVYIFCSGIAFWPSAPSSFLTVFFTSFTFVLSCICFWKSSFSMDQLSIAISNDVGQMKQSFNKTWINFINILNEK
ncbi:Hypothetical_protein [Hexamita inflata]|uniref:Hypothetical_protein n=1 Tax=Hexamita inflata TaxID=28002 RepID=A0AA86U694_9EUKA|nr:Hypothetical protein HINF_LOCUS19473 [Hexamita inflata]